MENQANGKSKNIITILAVLVAVLALTSALTSVYVAINPHILTVTQQQFLTQTQTNYQTQTESITETVTTATTTTSQAGYGNGYPCYGQYCYGNSGNGQLITVYGYLVQQSNCISLVTTSSYVQYALYNLPSPYPTGYVTVQGYQYGYGAYGSCPGIPLYVTNIF